MYYGCKVIFKPLIKIEIFMCCVETFFELK